MNGLLMNAHEAAEQGTAATYDPRPLLRVLLLYEDFATGARAKSIFDQLSARPELDAVFSLNLWRSDLLREPELNQHAAQDAAAADIIVFSSHGRNEPPLEIQLWLFGWLEKAGGSPAALVVSLDNDQSASPDEQGTLKFLRRITEPAGVVLFPHFGEPVGGGDEWTTDWVQRRVNSQSSLLEGILHHRSPYEHWGLND